MDADPEEDAEILSPCETPITAWDTCEIAELDYQIYAGGLDFCVDTSDAAADYGSDDCRGLPEVVLGIRGITPTGFYEFVCEGEGTVTWYYERDIGPEDCPPRDLVRVVETITCGSSRVTGFVAGDPGYLFYFCRDPHLPPAEVRLQGGF